MLMLLLGAQIFLLLCISDISAEDNGSMQIYNIYAKKCLSFSSNNSLELARCTYGLAVFFIKTAEGKLKGAHSGYQNKCIQYDQRTNSVTTGDCSSNYSISWTCEDRTLKTGDWYLSWNIQTDEIEVARNVSGREALWVVYETDNSVCDWPVRPRSTTTPFVQPTSPNTERHSEQLWPQGVYSLPKAASGCPGSTNFTWKQGWVFQDLDDTDMIMTKTSKSFNMAAKIDDWGNIKRWFCSKNDVTHNKQIRPLWPNGTYCIYSAGARCPQSEGKFYLGYGHWDNQYLLNDSEMKGVLPHGRFVRGGTTGIFFCCQRTQNPNIPMSLPVDQPFYLMAFTSSTCQKVKWATVSPEFVLYDTSDLRNGDKFSVYCPFNATKHDPKIHYCYYEGCKHILNYDNETEVEIKYPKSQYLDTTSQSCSWSIFFPLDYIILFNIISLDIPVNRSDHCNTQFLEISGLEGNVSNVKLCGNYQQYRVRSQSNLVLITLQLANNITNTTGFRLNFRGVLSRGERSTSRPGTEVPTTEIQRSSTLKTSMISEPTQKRNSEMRQTTDKIHTAKAAETKNKKSQVSTTSIVVPVVVVVLVGVMVIAWIVTRKRRKETNIAVAFANNKFAQENSIYEKETTDAKENENCNETFYESIDSDLVPRRGINKEFVENAVIPTEGNEDGHSNPLYESAGQGDLYSSTANSLYVSGDCQQTNI